MRLLLDENVGIKTWAELLRTNGHDVERVVDVGLQGASDTEVVAYACSNNRTLISRDKAGRGPGDLRSIWTAKVSPKPLLLLIYPGDVVTPSDILNAVTNLEAQGMVGDQVCAVNAWRFGRRI
jgi:predicted nuclease of predicted toxin-antitoxin system